MAKDQAKTDEQQSPDDLRDSLGTISGHATGIVAELEKLRVLHDAGRLTSETFDGSIEKALAMSVAVEDLMKGV